MNIEQLKAFIAGVIIGLLISGVIWLFRRGPSIRQLSRYLGALGMNNKEIATVVYYRNMAEFWARDWRKYRHNPAAARIPLPGRRTTRAPAIVAAMLGAWLLLSSFGPAPAPARQDARCLEVNAAFVLRQSVERPVQSNGVTIRVPAGYAVAWSCNSLDEAEIEMARRVAEIQAVRP